MSLDALGPGRCFAVHARSASRTVARSSRVSDRVSDLSRWMREVCWTGFTASASWRTAIPSIAPQDHLRLPFVADAPDRLWVTYITQHRTTEGWVYCAAVLDVFSRRVVGWSIADHLRTELVVDALEMARLRRKPVGTILHSDRGTQYTSWLFGHRLREAGLMGSMGKVACAYDNALMESFWGSMQIELLDRRYWTTRAELARAMFEWIEAFYNPVRRHSALDYRSPVEFEHLHKTANPAA
jgi:putative transposase